MTGKLNVLSALRRGQYQTQLACATESTSVLLSTPPHLAATALTHCNRPTSNLLTTCLVVPPTLKLIPTLAVAPIARETTSTPITMLRSVVEGGRNNWQPKDGVTGVSHTGAGNEWDSIWKSSRCIELRWSLSGITDRLRHVKGKCSETKEGLANWNETSKEPFERGYLARMAYENDEKGENKGWQGWVKSSCVQKMAWKGNNGCM